MFRRLSPCALTLLALLPAAPAPAATTAKPKPVSRAISTDFSVHYRRPGDTTWSEFASYPSHEEAVAATKKLYGEGYQVTLLARTTLTRPPSRIPKSNVGGTKAVSPQQAVAVFRWMAAQRDIAFRFPIDGCYARAHIMCRRMQQRGLRPAKVWAFAVSKKEPLFVRTKNRPKTGYVTWGWHVAPILPVRLKSGKQTWSVIDPSLFQGPVTIPQWRDKMRYPRGRTRPYVTVSRFGEAPVGVDGRRLAGSGYFPGPDPRGGVDAHAMYKMRRYKPWEGREPPESVLRAWIDRASFPTLQRDNRPLELARRDGRQLALAA
jgi:hypothetical protein